MGEIVVSGVRNIVTLGDPFYGSGNFWDSNNVNPNEGGEEPPIIVCARSARNAPVTIDNSKMPRLPTNQELENLAKVVKELQNLRAAMTVAANENISFKIDAEGEIADGEIPASELRDILNNVRLIPLPGYGLESNGGVGRVSRDNFSK